MRMQFKNKEWHLPLFISNEFFRLNIVLALSVLLVGTVQSQSVEVRQSSWEAHPMYRADFNCNIRNDTGQPPCKRFNRWTKTLTIHYVPQLPGISQGEPLGYIEKMYCAANPGYSCRCTNSCMGDIKIPEDGPHWNLTVNFQGANPSPSTGSLTGIENRDLWSGTGAYQVNHSSGRLVRGLTDTITGLPYGVGTVRYYVIAYGKDGNGKFTVTAGGATPTTHDMNLPDSPPH